MLASQFLGSFPKESHGDRGTQDLTDSRSLAVSSLGPKDQVLRMRTSWFWGGGGMSSLPWREVRTQFPHLQLPPRPRGWGRDEGTAQCVCRDHQTKS